MMLCKILSSFVYGVFLFGGVFSFEYDIRILNNTDHEIILRNEAVRNISIVGDAWQNYSFPSDKNKKTVNTRKTKKCKYIS